MTQEPKKPLIDTVVDPEETGVLAAFGGIVVNIPVDPDALKALIEEDAQAQSEE